MLKTEQTTIVYGHWGKSTSYERIKNAMITTDVIPK